MVCVKLDVCSCTVLIIFDLFFLILEIDIVWVCCWDMVYRNLTSSFVCFIFRLDGFAHIFAILHSIFADFN